MEFSQLLSAIEHGRLDLIHSWVASLHTQEETSLGIDGEVDPQFSASALHWACFYNKLDIAKFLLEKGASPNFRNAFQATPLHWACKSGSLPLVQLLLSYEAEPFLKNASDDTPLDIAVQAGATEIIALMEDPMTILQPGHAFTTSTQEGTNSSTTVLLQPTVQAKAQSPTSTSAVVQRLSETPYRANLVPTAVEVATADLESKLKYAMGTIEELRERMSRMLRDHMQLEEKSAECARLQKAVELHQREKIDLDLQLKQAKAWASSLQHSNSNNLPSGDASGSLAQELQDRISALERDNKRVREEAEKLRVVMEEERSSHSTHTQMKDSELWELRETVDRLSREKAKLELNVYRLDDLKCSLTDALKAKAMLQVEAASATGVKSVLSELQQENAGLEARFREADRTSMQEITALRREVALLEYRVKARRDLGSGTAGASVPATNASSAKNREEGESAAAEVSSLRTALAEAERLLRENQAKLQQADASQISLRECKLEVDFLKSHLATAQATLTQTSERLEAQLKVSASLEFDVTSARARISELESQLKARVSEEARTFQAELDGKASEISHLNTRIELLAEEKETLLQQHRLLEVTHQSLLHDHDSVTLRCDRLAADAAKNAQDFDVKQKDVTEMMENYRATMLNKIVALEAENENLQLDLKKVVEQLTEAKTVVSKVTEHNSQEVVDLRHVIEELTQDRLSLDTDNARLQQKLGGLQATLDASLASLKEKEANLASSRATIERGNSELRALNALCTELKAQLRAHEGENAKIQKYVDKQVTLLSREHEDEKEKLYALADGEIDKVRWEYEQVIEALRARLLLMEGEKQALLMQVHSLQDQATIAFESKSWKAPFAKLAPLRGGGGEALYPGTSGIRSPLGGGFPFEFSSNPWPSALTMTATPMAQPQQPQQPSSSLISRPSLSGGGGSSSGERRGSQKAVAGVGSATAAAVAAAAPITPSSGGGGGGRSGSVTALPPIS